MKGPSSESWDMPDCDPVADIIALRDTLNDPEEHRKYSERRAKYEKELDEAIQMAYDAGMESEEIFRIINGWVE